MHVALYRADHDMLGDPIFRLIEVVELDERTRTFTVRPMPGWDMAVALRPGLAASQILRAQATPLEKAISMAAHPSSQIVVERPLKISSEPRFGMFTPLT